MGTYFGDKDVKVYLGDKLVSGEELNPFPVGSIYMSIDSTSPAEYYGGTWEQIAGGRTLMGAGTGTDVDGVSKTISARGTGGYYGYPYHRHSISVLTTKSNYTGGGKLSSNTAYRARGTSASIDSYGSGTSGNVQPYYGIYVWKRIE